MSVQPLTISLKDLPAQTVIKPKLHSGPMKKAKRDIQEKIRARIADRVFENMETMLDAQVEAAEGAIVEGKQQPANTFAFKTLVELAGAGATQKIQHSGAVGIVALVKQLEHDDSNSIDTGEED